MKPTDEITCFLYRFSLFYFFFSISSPSCCSCLSMMYLQNFSFYFCVFRRRFSPSSFSFLSVTAACSPVFFFSCCCRYAIIVRVVFLSPTLFLPSSYLVVTRRRYYIGVLFIPFFPLLSAHRATTCVDFSFLSRYNILLVLYATPTFSNVCTHTHVFQLYRYNVGHAQ